MRVLGLVRGPCLPYNIYNKHTVCLMVQSLTTTGTINKEGADLNHNSNQSLCRVVLKFWCLAWLDHLVESMLSTAKNRHNDGFTPFQIFITVDYCDCLNCNCNSNCVKLVSCRRREDCLHSTIVGLLQVVTIVCSEDKKSKDIGCWPININKIDSFPEYARYYALPKKHVDKV